MRFTRDDELVYTFYNPYRKPQPGMFDRFTGFLRTRDEAGYYHKPVLCGHLNAKGKYRFFKSKKCEPTLGEDFADDDDDIYEDSTYTADDRENDIVVEQDPYGYDTDVGEMYRFIYRITIWVV